MFAKYIMGQVPLLPWCEVPLQSETSTISTDLVAINRAGYLTINSQVHSHCMVSVLIIISILPL